jgi:hypothetical protein
MVLARSVARNPGQNDRASGALQDSSRDGFAQVLNPLLGPLALNGGTTPDRLPLPAAC